MKTKKAIAFGITAIIIGIVIGIIGLGQLDWKVSALGEQFEEKTFTTTENVTSVKVDLRRFNLKVVSGAEFKVDYKESERSAFDVALNDGKLNITEVYTRKHDFFNVFNFTFSSLIVVVTVPANYTIDVISTDSINGSIEVMDIDLKKFDLKTTNGSVDFTNVKSDEIKINTTNAHIELENVTADSITATTTNGHIELGKITAKSVEAKTTNSSVETDNIKADSLSVTSTNGKLEISNVESATTVLKTTNSKIVLKDLNSNDIKVTTSNGSIKGNIIGKREDFNITSYTTNGSSSIGNEPGNGSGKRLDVSTTNSSIDVTFS